MCPFLFSFMEQSTHAHIGNPIPKNIQVVSSGFIVLKNHKAEQNVGRGNK